MSASELVLMAPISRPALRPARQGTLAQALLVALGIHAALLALLVLFIRPARLPETAGAPAFTMVFAPETPLEPAKASPSPAPQPPVPPTEAEATAPPAPEPPPASEPLPTAEAPPPAPTLTEPTPETAAPPAAMAAPPLSEVPTAPPPALPTAPPPPIPIPPRPPVEVRPPPRPAAPPRLPNRLPYHPASRTLQAPAGREEAPSTVASPPRAPVETQLSTARPAAAPISGGWRNALIDWLQAHKTYPEAARTEGAEGRVVLRFTASRDGRVLQVAVVQPSGSRVLDAAAEALLRGARLPPFPASMTQDTATVTLPLTYQLE